MDGLRWYSKDTVLRWLLASLTEEINEQSSNGLENFGFDEETPELFNSEEDASIQDLASSENEHKEPEEDDLEIPAFLRRQKN